MSPSSAAERLLVVLDHPGGGNPCVRQLTRTLRRTPQILADRFDYYENLCEAVGAQRAARMVVSAARAAHRGWVE